MREIKFRAWATWSELTPKMYGPFTLKEYAEDQDSYGGGHINFPDYTIDMILMQYTGLKDKNGKEIYEGDIVKYQDIWTNAAIKTDVVTMESFPVYWLENEEWGYEGEQLVSPSITEVIGNIYENSDLINKHE